MRAGEARKIIRRARRFVAAERRTFLECHTVCATGKPADLDCDADRAVLKTYDELHRHLGELLVWASKKGEQE